MPGNIYSGHFQATLGAGGAARYSAYLKAPATHHINLLLVKVDCDFDSTAGDDPVAAKLERVTGTAAGGTTLTPTKHDSENSLASQATAMMGDTITGLTEVDDSVLWEGYINPKDSFKPGLKLAPSEAVALELDPGTEAREAKISFYWEE